MTHKVNAKVSVVLKCSNTKICKKIISLKLRRKDLNLLVNVIPGFRYHRSEDFLSDEHHKYIFLQNEIIICSNLC